MQKRVREIFIKLRDGHHLYEQGDLAYKDRLEKAFEPFLVELEVFGVPRHFAESLLYFGAEFVESLTNDDDIGSADLRVVKAIFAG